MVDIAAILRFYDTGEVSPFTRDTGRNISSLDLQLSALLTQKRSVQDRIYAIQAESICYTSRSHLLKTNIIQLARLKAQIFIYALKHR